MREILFRGRQTDKEKWIYGVPVKGTSEDESEILIIENVFKCDEYACRGCDFTPVIPETVGQYTGLADKNGKKIFEGDIVKVVGMEVTVNGNYQVVFDDINHCWGLKRAAEYHHSYFTFSSLNGFNEDAEAIGNIHDNPELL